MPEALATVFDSFLLGISVLVRDGVPLKQINDVVTQIMTMGCVVYRSSGSWLIVLCTMS